jgi:IS605 OrfB family transposase
MPDEGASGPARRTWEKQVRELLPEVADKLGRNPQLCRKLNAAWTTRWLKDDREWKPRLRWLRNWLLPHGDQAGPSVRHVGGLSLDRLSNIRELYQLMKAYRTRPEPDDPRKNVPARGDSSLDKYGQRILDALDRMRDNRVKQLASRIAEAALGIGRENGCGEKRPQARVFEPCHAIVVENLERYRPEQTRTRRENRQLMRWSAAKVGKCLNEACELNGLLLRNVMPNYTSRQDSRTGAAGARCTDLPVAEFLRRFGPKAVALRKEKDATSKYLVELVDHWQKRSAAEQESGIVRIPQDGGELFVSTDPQSPAAKGLQADLNAAANIGLRALLDPDWPGKWWWIPCGRDGKPDKEKCKGTAAFKLDARLLPEATGKGKDIVNAWRDVSAARIGPEQWQGYSEYWNGIKARVVDVLRRQAGLA